MSPVLVNVFKVLFVVVLYGFLWIVARAVRAHLGTAANPTDRTAAGSGTITITEPPAAAGRILTVEQPTLIGRSGEADITLDDPFISDRHVRFDRVEGRLVVEDLGSTNGTLVNGIPVIGRRALDRGDVIRIGQTIMEVR